MSCPWCRASWIGGTPSNAEHTNHLWFMRMDAGLFPVTKATRYRLDDEEVGLMFLANNAVRERLRLAAGERSRKSAAPQRLASSIRVGEPPFAAPRGSCFMASR